MFLASTLAACAVRPAASSANPVAASDATTTDPDKYHVVLDNEHVRVLDYTDRPGQKTSLHHHPDFVLHALGPFERRLHFADGTSRVVSFHGGETVFMPAQTHAGENIGTTDTHVLIVELKHR
jgi:quercetin dioxygenase-like cupin family protein